MQLRTRKNKKSYTAIDMFNTYRKETNVDMPYLRFKRILEEFNKVIRDKLLNASDGFKMPYGLGYIRIVKYKPKSYDKHSLSVDYAATNKYGKTIYHLNEHSNGYKFRLYWSKLPQTFPDRYKYQLCFVRENKRKLAQLIFNNKDYINIDDIQVYQM